MRNLLSVFLLACLLVATVQAGEQQPPAGPVAAGMMFEGTFRSGEPNKQGILKKAMVSNFTLKFDSVNGEAFAGTWTWDDKIVTKVEGLVKKSGAITLRFTKDIKGKSPATFDGQAAGKVTDKALQLRYVRPSGSRIGLVEGKIKAEEKK